MQEKRDPQDMSKKEMVREVMSTSSTFGPMVEQFADIMGAMFEVKTGDEPTEEIRSEMEAIIYERIFVDTINEVFIDPGTEQLSDETVRELLHFFRSDVGQEFASFMEDTQPEFTEKIQENADDAMSAIIDELA